MKNLQVKRKVDIAVISDVHLGTYGCHAKELLVYLKSIKPKTLILNGDLIDIWQFSKRYWPKSHMKVVKYVLSLIGKGTNMYLNSGDWIENLTALEYANGKWDIYQFDPASILPTDANVKEEEEVLD